MSSSSANGRMLRAVCVVALAAASSGAQAQSVSYPARPVRVVVATAAASGADVAARVAAARLSTAFGQQFVIENRPGAAGNIAAESVARATPDGYTLLVIVAGMTSNPALYSKLSYDLEKDFDPIGLIATAPLVLAVHPSLPVKSVKDLIALAKARPGQLYYASSGNGSSPHLAAEMFRAQAKINIVHVPYKGSPQAVTDLISGQVNMMFAATSSLMPHAESGRLRALAVGSAKRSSTAPGVPSMAEAGLPGYEASTWYGLVAPAGTPQEISTRVSRELANALRTPEVRSQLAAQRLDPVPSTPAEFGEYLKAEIAKWGKTVKAVGARVD